MKATDAPRVRNAAVVITGLLLSLTVQAEIKSHSSNLVIEQPADLPQMAQTPGESLLVYHAGDETYLYVEQQEGTRLAIFDVADPAKIKPVSSIELNSHRPFDFVRALNDKAELIRFRDNQQLAVIDLHKAKNPTLKIENALDEPGHTESSGATGFLIINEPETSIKTATHDYQVVDTSNPAGPTPLATIKRVKHTVVDRQTGTTYLSGSDGLTVIRRPRVEDDYEIHEIQMEPN
jgi:hypothetical protein